MDDIGVRKHVAGRVLEQVQWEELASLDIRATIQKHGGLPLVWILTDRSDAQVVVPFQQEPEGFLGRVQMLPGFQEGQFVASMRATSDATFPCWRASTA